MLFDCYRNQRVLVTGHTGFKGSWLCEWLLRLGADVTGYALPAPTRPALFEQLSLASRMRHVVGDVRDSDELRQLIAGLKPVYVFHLAAQPIVRHSYAEPVETFSTNVLGTVHLLEAVRQSKLPCNVVVTTTDKCYENGGGARVFHENDRLGGHDPYSASKACAEIAAAAYHKSYFSMEDRVHLATARAGNVLGGGDWAPDRLLPDCIRCLLAGKPIEVRNPGSIRPWQHVLESLSGYLLLGARLADTPTARGSFNFGPTDQAHRTVRDVVTHVLQRWPGQWTDASNRAQPHEAECLHLSIQKAEEVLAWRPVWTFEQNIDATVDWYHRCRERTGLEVVHHTQKQISGYSADAKAEGLEWAR